MTKPLRVDVSYILNELDVLEIRLNILNDVVDTFIIVECTETFSGVPKSLCFDIHDTRWATWKHKLQHYVVDDFPMDDTTYAMALRSPCTGTHEHYWIREFYIKESARKAIKGLHKDDIVFISDMDEIWNPKLTYAPKGDEVLKPKQIPYLYYLNQRTDEDWLGWTGTTVCRYETIEKGIINHIRTDSMQEYTVMREGGWHVNSIGGKQKKVDASKHPLSNEDHDWDRREVNMRIDESELPDYLIHNKETWKRLYKAKPFQ